MPAVSADLLRAILEARDHRHNEAHAALLALWQGLVAELVETGLLVPDRLADRVTHALGGVDPAPHGDAARTLVAHVADWTATLRRREAVPPPSRWTAPPLGEE